ncbi:MAG TPA: molybdopterin-synthase adenylyltransferase MoeB [Chthoniobacterales bacterium]|nr:molybdopterin-synthase adenylyltransferase MoeB [Chthoniobacterales bacterium]
MGAGENITTSSPNEKAGASLGEEERRRYSRHIMLPEIGVAGQERLKAARVLCLGTGGLGSPAALYLAAAGVGTIGLVDDDRVALSNLHRQLLHGTKDVGRPKTESARDRLVETNPHVAVQLHACRFTSGNAEGILRDYDLIVDGTDNFATRYLSNDVAVFARKPNVYGSIFRFDGQATVFAPHLGGPCYRCLFPEPPPPGAVPSCAEAGVLGVLPGMIGTLQATEALKLILGLGETLVGRLVHFDALKMKFREFNLRRDPDCPVCGRQPTITAPIDYETFCHGGPDLTAAVPQIQVRALEQRMASGEPYILLDVREPFEFELARIAGANLIPLGQLPARFGELDREKEIFVFCHSGVRSERAAEFLRAAGFPKIANVAGGIDAWSEEIDPDVPRY